MSEPDPSTQADPAWAFLEPQEPGGPRVLGGYRIVKQLGQGGMGVVFQAEDPRLRRPIALKVMHPDVAAHDQAKDRILEP